MLSRKSVLSAGLWLGVTLLGLFLLRRCAQPGSSTPTVVAVSQALRSEPTPPPAPAATANSGAEQPSADAAPEANPDALSADHAEAEVQAVRARCEAALHDGVELVRRRAGVEEWKAFAAARGLVIHVIEIDDKAASYRVALTTREIPILESNGRVTFLIDQHMTDVGLIGFHVGEKGIMTDYKPYMGRTIIADRRMP